jgi:hypothetical protein
MLVTLPCAVGIALALQSSNSGGRHPSLTRRPSVRSTRSSSRASEAARLLAERPVPAEAQACANCGSTRVTTLSLMLEAERPVDFTSCQMCEHKTWRDATGVLPLESIKATASAAAASRRRRSGPDGD